MSNIRDYIWDIETFPNCFSFCAINAVTKDIVIFEISNRKDERQQMLSFLRKLYVEKARLVGFNSIGFDYNVLHYILTNKQCSVFQIYKKAMAIIEAQNDEDKFANIVRAKDRLIEQIDLFKIHHFDNRARATSLKVIEFNMRSETIEDLPFPVGKDLTGKQIDILLEYNKHDVLKTLDFYFETYPKIQFREALTAKYNRDFMNHNDTKIGKDYFVMRLEEQNPEACYKVVNNRRVMQQTRRTKINLNDCIFPYVEFTRPEFNAILTWLKKQSITETKGVFSDLLESDLGEVAKYAEMVIKSKKATGQPSAKEIAQFRRQYPMGWVDERALKSGKGKISYYFCWKIAETLNVVVDGLRYDFGTGGLHGSMSNTIVRATPKRKLKDADVSSMYPNLGISNNVYPEHLGLTFCRVYKDVYEQRQTFAKGTDENATMKLALNGVYGDSNSQFSPFYDPMYTMKITINGQLSLCMLIERFLKIEGCKVIQANTDGVTVSIPIEHEAEYDRTCKEWEKVVKLQLEFVDYSSMHIRDVNNYVAISTKGKVKRKGAYEYADLEHSKNQSTLVIPKAAEHHILGKGTVEEFIKRHDDKFDFMSRVKVPRSNQLISVDEFGKQTLEQNTGRYYVTNEGSELVKIMPALEGGKNVKVWYDSKREREIETETTAQEQGLQKRIQDGVVKLVREYYKPNEERPQSIEAGYKVTMCNNINCYRGDINYDYYIDQAKKLVAEMVELNFDEEM